MKISKKKYTIKEYVECLFSILIYKNGEFFSENSKYSNLMNFNSSHSPAETKRQSKLFLTIINTKERTVPICLKLP